MMSFIRLLIFIRTDFYKKNKKIKRVLTEKEEILTNEKDFRKKKRFSQTKRIQKDLHKKKRFTRIKKIFGKRKDSHRQKGFRKIFIKRRDSHK